MAESRYKVLSKWASGGMADIYVARQQAAGGFDKLVALKFLRDQGNSDAVREMFLDEVKTAALLNHPNIVQTFDAGEIDDRLYMAMEFVNGETLSRFGRVVARHKDGFPVELAVAIIRDLANALDYAHALTTLEGAPLHVVHRDVSPSNVLLSFEGGLKLLDFGIARVATRLEATKDGTLKGKYSYMAPEQALGDAVDRRADIYALGILLWQLLTGKPAFVADSDAELLAQVVKPTWKTPSEAGAKCSKELDDIVMRALAFAPVDRYATAGALATELTAHLATLAPAYDSTRVIRELMGELFGERKERLARIVKGLHESDLSLEEIDLLSNWSLKTPAPKLMFPSTSEADDVEITGVDTSPPEAMISPEPTPAPTAPTQPPAQPKRRTWLWATLVLVLVAGGAFAAYNAGASQQKTSMAASRQDVVASTQPTPATAPPSTPPPPPPTPSVPATAPLDVATPDPTPAPVVSPPSDPAPAAKLARTTTKLKTPKSSPKPSTSVAVAEATPPPTPAQAPTPALPTTPTPVPTPTPPPAPTPAPTPTPAPPPETKPAVVSAPTPPVVKPAAPNPGTLDAVPAVASVVVDGPLPDSEIRSSAERSLSALRDCYRAAAKQSNKTPVVQVTVSFVIDEGRAARDIRVAGDTLGVSACVKTAVAKVRTRVAPDVGTAAVNLVVRFQPTK